MSLPTAIVLFGLGAAVVLPAGYYIGRGFGLGRPWSAALALVVYAGAAVVGAVGAVPESRALQFAFAVGGVTYLGGALWTVRALEHWRRWRLVLGTSPSRAAETLSGPVALDGSAAVADGTTTAPVSGRECLVYTYEVERYARGYRGHVWDPVARGQDGVPFELADGSGAVTVDPDGADIVTGGAVNVEKAADEEPTPALAALNDVAGVSDGDRLRYTEATIEPGDPVYVLGEATQSGGRAAADRLTVRSTEETPGVIVTGDREAAVERFRTIVERGGPVGALLLVGGLAVMLGVTV